MILSNTEIVKCLKEKLFSITPLDSLDANKHPFNTSAVDLCLGDEINILKATVPVVIDLTKPDIAQLIKAHSKKLTISADQPYKLKPNTFVLANTFESVNFPFNNSMSYSARVEGKSSLARCGILIHFTAPTIHAGFQGTITLEIINLGVFDFLLTPRMSICQLIIEEIRGTPMEAPNQFKGQTNPAGTK